MAFLPVLLNSCGTYRYYQPTFNPMLFHNKNEVHVSGEVSNAGLQAKTAMSLGKHIAVIGQYNSSALKYRVREGEVGLGFYNAGGEKGCIAAGGGLGFGNNYAFFDNNYTVKEYEGKFIRPFVQFNAGAASGDIAGGIKGDFIFSFKASYLKYDGRHLDGTMDNIKSRYITLEPAFMAGLGARSVRFDIYYGLPFRPSFEGLSKHYEARTFPLNVGFGLRFLFGVKPDELLGE